MPKIVILGKRAEGSSVDRVRTRCADHIQAALSGFAGVRRHVESLPLSSAYRRGEPIYDAVHEVWFRDEATARTAGTSAAVRGLSGGALFDPATFAVLLTQDHLLKDGPVPTGGLKSFEFVTRLTGLPLTEFRRYWREVHGPLAARIEIMRRYVQSHCLLSCYEHGQQPVWDGLAITWFDDISAMRVSAATPEYGLTRADEPNFLAPGVLPSLITTERELEAG